MHKAKTFDTPFGKLTLTILRVEPHEYDGSRFIAVWNVKIPGKLDGDDEIISLFSHDNHIFDWNNIDTRSNSDKERIVALLLENFEAFFNADDEDSFLTFEFVDMESEVDDEGRHERFEDNISCPTFTVSTGLKIS